MSILLGMGSGRTSALSPPAYSPAGARFRFMPLKAGPAGTEAANFPALHCRNRVDKDRMAR